MSFKPIFHTNILNFHRFWDFYTHILHWKYYLRSIRFQGDQFPNFIDLEPISEATESIKNQVIFSRRNLQFTTSGTGSLTPLVSTTHSQEIFHKNLSLKKRSENQII